MLPFAQPGTVVLARAGFLTENLWVTPYDGEERFRAGEYPNQNPGGDACRSGRNQTETSRGVIWSSGARSVRRTYLGNRFGAGDQPELRSRHH